MDRKNGGLVDLTSGREGFPWTLAHPLLRLAEDVLGIPGLNQVYHDAAERARRDGTFCRGALESLGLGYDLPAQDWLRIPAEGPLVVVANHPIGSPEALVLGDILDRVRPDHVFLGNYLLDRMPEFRDRVIAVDPFGGKDAARRNIRSMRRALEHLKRGGVLVIFPAGTVSHLHVRQMTVTDPEWSPHVARLIRQSGAAVVAAYFDARNSWFFQIAGLAHPLLRTLLLARQMLRWRGRTLRVFFSRPLPAEKLAHHGSDRKLMDFLRAAVYVQQGRDPERAAELAPVEGQQAEPLIAAVEPARMEEEVGALPEEQKLIRQSGFMVCCTAASSIPNVLREIARLRELTFRAVGEGTGRSMDLEPFDSDYLHLFIWNEVTREVVGAYRLGLTDRIIPTRGARGLYTSTLFRYRPGFFRQLGPSIELGRSFIRPEYQRKYQSLMLLWRGIGEFVARNPQYPVLLGPVSISREYQSLSRNLLVHFLRRHNGSRWLGWQVRASHPPRREHMPGLNAAWFARTADSVEDVSALVAEVEQDGKGIPVLLRHYLKLNAQLISFNVDPAFSDVLDGLLLVDLRRSDRRLLDRFLGTEGAARFADYHEVRGTPRRLPAALARLARRPRRLSPPA